MNETTVRDDPAGADHTGTGAPVRGHRALRDLRIRTKLGLILIAPLIAIGGLAGARLVDSVGQAGQAQLLRSLAAISAESATLAHELHRERLAAARIATSEAHQDLFQLAIRRTDEVVTGYYTARGEVPAPPALISAHYAAIDAQLAELGEIRGEVTGDGQASASITVAGLRYAAITDRLQASTAALVELVDDPQLSAGIRAVSAFSAAKGHAADAEAVTALAGGAQPPGLLAAQAGQAEALVAFERAANAAQRGAADLIAGTSASQPAMKLVEDQLLDQLLTAASQRRDAVYRQAFIETGAVGLAVLATIGLALLLASGLARSLRTLQATALRVAERELPAAVARLADPASLGQYTPAQLAGRVAQPAALRGNDEIGQVAHALTTVQRAAVRVAAEQAALRASVSAMFLNLARRSQGLVDKMISQLDEVQHREVDPARLGRMFALDNLATRMRRNDENLLVLAGAGASPPRQHDVVIGDVLRAAQSEIEAYDRVEFGTVDEDVYVTAAAINDVVRVLAELLDNATRFSPPASAVVCEARRLGDQLIIQIEDLGVGIGNAELDQLNASLAAPTTIDVTSLRRMGVAVIGRLAARHQIRVGLRSPHHQGTIASVSLPPQILVLPAGRRRPLPPARATAPTAPPARVAAPPAGPPGAAPVELPAAGRPPAPPTRTAPPRPTDPPAATVELPIFRAVESSWFRGAERGRRGPGGSAGAWQTAADQGWALAAAAEHPPAAGATQAGLPRRVPLAQLLPGSAGSPAPAARAPRSPTELRGVLSAYQRGVNRAREREP